jgi:hypothetical protein
MIMQTQPRDDWDEFDFLLIEAYQILESERCSQCGLPRWICHSEDSDVRIDLRDDTCFVKREIDAEKELHSKDANYVAPHGTVTVPDVSTWSKKPLDFRVREQYYEGLIAAKSKA